MQIPAIQTTKIVNGDRIKQARELRGLTQVELASRTNVSQPAIAQLEQQSGLAFAPSLELLEAIALQLGFPLSFFTQESAPEFPLGSLLYRKKSSLKTIDKNKVRQLARLAYEMAERMASRLKMPPLTLPAITDNNPIIAAHLMRSSLGLSPDTPVKNLIHQLEKNGLFVIAIPYTIDEHDSFSLWVSDQSLPKPVIVLSTGKPGDRQRFNVAHELAHVVMHRAFQGTLKDMETQANQFAAELLMPAETMKQQIIPPVTLSQLAALKPKWGVSIQALTKRAYDLGIITYRQYTYLFQQITERGWRIREPENLDITAEKPRALRKMAEVLYGTPINIGKLASDMQIPVSLAELILSTHAEKPEMPTKPKEEPKSETKGHFKQKNLPNNVDSIRSKRR